MLTQDYRLNSPTRAIKHFESQGFYLVPKLFTQKEVDGIKSTLESFHRNWQLDNQQHYQSRAINSAYLTGRKYLTEPEQTSLFKFIAQSKLMSYVLVHFDPSPAFLNTQLFFNPVNKKQKNYWHRDTQYHLDLEQQKQIMSRSDLLHFRIAMADEPGIELVPTTHRRWDSSLEQDVRLEKNGRKNFEPLPNTQQIPMQAGDLLVFSGNMLHRGIYGLNRLALDILYCENDPDFLQFVDPDVLPSNKQLEQLEHPEPFLNSLSSIIRHDDHDGQ